VLAVESEGRAASRKEFVSVCLTGCLSVGVFMAEGREGCRHVTVAPYRVR
jgi:hypothetical protein